MTGHAYQGNVSERANGKCHTGPETALQSLDSEKKMGGASATDFNKNTNTIVCPVGNVYG
jgi:hypothetical protein